MKEMLGGCCVCADENGWEANPLVYCDGPNCEVAVHQGCYGIIEVPEGEWYCAKCADMLQHLRHNGNSNNNSNVDIRESPRCELCPFGDGALKRTDSDGWAHVICALYIPEVRFGDVHSMDPVIISDVPLERFQQPCYLCTERGEDKRALQGACMSCNKPGCKKGFHVTCAQAEGLLCEEGGGSKNVKYCGYCSAHAKKAFQIGDPLIKIIPAYRHRAQSSSCSSTTSGGGQQISPRLNNASNGIPQSTDHYINRRLLSSLSPISSSHLYNTTNTTTTTTSNSNSTSTNSSSNNPNRSTSIISLSGSAAPRNIASTLNVLSSNSTDPLNRQRDNNSISTTSSNAMLLDPIQRTPLPPTSVDRAMMNVVLSQPLGAHHATIIDDTCSPPVSSGRSSIVRDTPPPAAAALSSSKCDQPSNLEILASSATIVPLPSNMGTLIGSSLVKPDISPVLSDKGLNNGLLTSTSPAGTDLSSPNSIHNSLDNNKHTPPLSTSASSVHKSVKRPKPAEIGDKPKRPRNHKTSKSVKALLESVGPLISETVSDFQRERVSERDAIAAATTLPTASTVSHLSLPSTSNDNNNNSNHNISTTNSSTNMFSSSNIVNSNIQTSAQNNASSMSQAKTTTISTANALSSVNSPSHTNVNNNLSISYQQPSTSSTNISANLNLNTNSINSNSMTLTGAPLLRTLSKSINYSSDVNPTNAQVDRHHVSASLPSTSLGLSAGSSINSNAIAVAASTSGASTSGSSQQHHSPFPQSMEELLERQWEQGSHFLMSHAPFDIAQLLSCLHELKMENVRLEESMAQLVRRRDHLLALNARLSLSLSAGNGANTSSTSFNSTSPHHSPRIGVGNGSQSTSSLLSSQSAALLQAQQHAQQVLSLPSTSQNLLTTIPNPLPPISTSSLSNTLNNNSSMSSNSLLSQQQQPSISLSSNNNPNTSQQSIYSTPLSIDDSLNQLRSLANTNNLKNMPSSSASSNPLVPRPSSRQTPSTHSISITTPSTSSLQQSAGITLGTPLPQQQQQQAQTPFSTNRIPSTLSAASSVTPTSLSSGSVQQQSQSMNAPKASPSTSTPSTSLSNGPPCSSAAASLLSGIDMLTNSVTNISPERQQQLAAAAIAAATANAISNNFMNQSRNQSQLNNTNAGANNPLQQFASQDLLTQYALLAQHQLLQQQVAAAALSARYSGIVIPGNSTPPSSTSNNTNSINSNNNSNNSNNNASNSGK